MKKKKKKKEGDDGKDLRKKKKDDDDVSGKANPYTITERRVPELIPVLGSQLAGDVSHKPGGYRAILTRVVSR